MDAEPSKGEWAVVPSAAARDAPSAITRRPDAAVPRIADKLDYYDKHDQNFGSEDPADPAKTLRIGTLMMPEEY